MPDNIENKVICLWKNLVKDKTATSFDENYKVKCRECDGYRTKEECKDYWAKKKK